MISNKQIIKLRDGIINDTNRLPELVDLLYICQEECTKTSDNISKVQATSSLIVESLFLIFTHYNKTIPFLAPNMDSIFVSSKNNSKSKKQLSTKMKATLWIYDKYKHFESILFMLLNHQTKILPSKNENPKNNNNNNKNQQITENKDKIQPKYYHAVGVEACKILFKFAAILSVADPISIGKSTNNDDMSRESTTTMGNIMSGGSSSSSSSSISTSTSANGTGFKVIDNKTIAFNKSVDTCIVSVNSDLFKKLSLYLILMPNIASGMRSVYLQYLKENPKCLDSFVYCARKSRECLIQAFVKHIFDNDLKHYLKFLAAKSKSQSKQSKQSNKNKQTKNKQKKQQQNQQQQNQQQQYQHQHKQEANLNLAHLHSLVDILVQLCKDNDGVIMTGQKKLNKSCKDGKTNSRRYIQTSLNLQNKLSTVYCNNMLDLLLKLKSLLETSQAMKLETKVNDISNLSNDKSHDTDSNRAIASLYDYYNRNPNASTRAQIEQEQTQVQADGTLPPPFKRARLTINGGDNDYESPFGQNGTVNSIDIIGVRKKLLSRAWLGYLGQRNLPIQIYHVILTRLMSDVFPCFEDPLVLCDFLTDSYNIGGEISLLSLHGLFILINKYNFDYPNFYQQLYKRVDCNIFFSKNCKQFFELLSLFLLKTSHIPEYMVASFTKRLSRMSLFAPPNGVIFVTGLIANLLRRYPAIRYLVDRSEAGHENPQSVIKAIRINKSQKMIVKHDKNSQEAQFLDSDSDDSDSDDDNDKDKDLNENEDQNEENTNEIKNEENENGNGNENDSNDSDNSEDDEDVEDEDEDEDDVKEQRAGGSIFDEMIESDPFDYDCNDMKECGATKSSLWELKALTYHYEFKTAGHCHETINHFQNRLYKPVKLKKCQFFQYNKLLNFYFQKHTKDNKNYQLRQKRLNKKKEKLSSTKNEENRQLRREISKEQEALDKGNPYRISFDRKEHLFDKNSIFGDAWTI